VAGFGRDASLSSPEALANDRWSGADEAACAVAFLTSSAASSVSGGAPFVDGGWTAIDGPPTGLTQRVR
jgi:NAD(P)-dependent dehydrogenase (short-subunit alcohol dehydrogenase family)